MVVANHLKHGVMTVRRAGKGAGPGGHGAHAGSDGTQQAGSHMSMLMSSGKVTPPLIAMTLLSFIALAPGGTIAFLVQRTPAHIN